MAASSAKLQVDRCSRDTLAFDVIVSEGSSKTLHRVTMTDTMCAKLAGERYTPEQLVGAAFRFLLDREAKESILPRFDLAEIARYFPEFERAISSYLPR